MASSYDDRNLQKLFAELQPKRRRQAIKGALRRAATKVKRTAISNLGSCVNSTPELEKGVRALVWKRRAGFRVTVGEKYADKNGKGEQGFYQSRRQRLKDGKSRKYPVLRWLEDGTKVRKSKSDTLYKIGDRYITGRKRGFIKRYGFMRKTVNQVSGTITETVKSEVINNVKRVAKKYGCT